MSFENSIFAIVGGSSGIGLAVARRVAVEGGRPLMIARNPDRLAAVASEISGAITATADTLDPSSIGGAMKVAGPIDHLVVTAASDERKRIVAIGEASEAHFSDSFDRIRGVLNAVRAAAPHLSAGASVTLLCGVSAVKPMKGGALLAAESGALAALARALAIDLAPVRANAIMAGVVDTPIHGDQRGAIEAWAQTSLPARRFGRPEDIADAVMFAAGNPYLTGSLITVDGGLTVS